MASRPARNRASARLLVAACNAMLFSRAACELRRSVMSSPVATRWVTAPSGDDGSMIGTSPSSTIPKLPSPRK
jgi:hypothetical protein